MSETRNSSSTGTAICLVALSVLVALKLTGAIDWSWWVVTSPLWGPIVIGLMFAGLAIAVVLVALLPLSAFNWIARVMRKHRGRHVTGRKL